MIGGESGEDLAIKSNVFLFQSSHEFAIGGAKSFGRGADACLEEAAEVVLFVSAMSKGVHASMHDSLICLALLGSATKTIPLYLAEGLAASLQCVDSFFDSRHKITGGRL